MTIILTQQDAVAIKARLWEGISQQRVAAEFDVTQATVSRISRGAQWYTAHWPDGHVGPMPIDRKRLLVRKSRQTIYADIETSNGIQQSPITISELAEEAAAIMAEEEDAAYIREQNALALSSPSGSPQVEQPSPEIRFDPDIWKTFLTVAPDNPYIRAAEASGEEIEKLAVIQTFGALPDHMWDEKGTAVYIRAAKEEIKRHLAKNSA